MNQSRDIKTESSDTLAIFLADEYETLIMCQRNIAILRQEIANRKTETEKGKKNDEKLA